MEACYREFICVENAVAVKPIALQPGASWKAKVTIEDLMKVADKTYADAEGVFLSSSGDLSLF